MTAREAARRYSASWERATVGFATALLHHWLGHDLILPVHHCFMHTLANTHAIKIIENDRGIAYMKHLAANPT